MRCYGKVSIQLGAVCKSCQAVINCFDGLRELLCNEIVQKHILLFEMIHQDFELCLQKLLWVVN